MKLIKQDGINSRVNGEIAELEFVKKCLVLGIDIAKPIIDTGYDFLIYIEESWKRVQVKQASIYSPSSTYKYYRVDLTGGRQDIEEYKKNFDYVAIVRDSYVWLIPCSEIKGRYKNLTKNYNEYLI